jgi:hypothetical protein
VRKGGGVAGFRVREKGLGQWKEREGEKEEEVER